MSESVEFVTGPRDSGETATIESVADILERELQSVIVDWLARVEQEPDLKCIPLNFEDRTGHLPHLLHDVIARLRLDAGKKAPISKAAAEHGDLRRKTRLHGCDGGGGVPSTAGHYFFDAAQKREELRIQLAASRRCDDRERGGRAVEGADAALHGSGCREDGQGQVTCFCRIRSPFLTLPSNA